MAIRVCLYCGARLYKAPFEVDPTRVGYRGQGLFCSQSHGYEFALFFIREYPEIVEEYFSDMKLALRRQKLEEKKNASVSSPRRTPDGKEG